MAKPRKKRAGLHKDVSSVLEDVPIPQGVRNWQPPDEFGPDWTGDSMAVPKSNISSVFKGVPDPADNYSRQPTYEHAQAHSANGSPIQTLEDSQISQTDSAPKPDHAKEPMPEMAGGKQIGAEDHVACYHDPLVETSCRSLIRWIREKLFCVKS